MWKNTQIVIALEPDTDQNYVLKPQTTKQDPPLLFECTQVQTAISQISFTAQDTGNQKYVLTSQPIKKEAPSLFEPAQVRLLLAQTALLPKLHLFSTRTQTTLLIHFFYIHSFFSAYFLKFFIFTP